MMMLFGEKDGFPQIVARKRAAQVRQAMRRVHPGNLGMGEVMRRALRIMRSQDGRFRRKDAASGAAAHGC